MGNKVSSSCGRACLQPRRIASAAAREVNVPLNLSGMTRILSDTAFVEFFKAIPVIFVLAEGLLFPLKSRVSVAV
jgi:hypothetical protein